MDNLRGEYLGGPDTVIHSPGNIQRPRLQPYSPGLRDRLWYGGGSLRSVRWAGAAGLNLLTGNVVIGERSDDFTTTQRDLMAPTVAPATGIAAMRRAGTSAPSPRRANGGSSSRPTWSARPPRSSTGSPPTRSSD
ncbi:luciferase-like monooxygenase [Mycobacteroides abscessus subsp. abscessus]|nr:luciferase-like monooxygenase [Mycobacteroides abscessus subsp. abscessus]